MNGFHFEQSNSSCRLTVIEVIQNIQSSLKQAQLSVPSIMTTSSTTVKGQIATNNKFPKNISSSRTVMTYSLQGWSAASRQLQAIYYGQQKNPSNIQNSTKQNHHYLSRIKIIRKIKIQKRTENISRQQLVLLWSYQFYKQPSSYTLPLELLNLSMNSNNRMNRRDSRSQYPDRRGISALHDYKKGRSQQRGRQYQSKSKTKVPKIQLILEQAKQQLAQPFPNPDFLMLTCFTEMTKHQKQSLTQEWKNHLTAHLQNLPRLKLQMEAQSIGRQQQNASGSCQKQRQWMQANTRDIQLEIAAVSNTFEMQCRQLRLMYLKILRTNDFIQY